MLKMQSLITVLSFFLAFIPIAVSLPKNKTRPAFGLIGHEMPPSCDVSNSGTNARTRTPSRHSEVRTSSLSEVAAASGMCTHIHSQAAATYHTHTTPCYIVQIQTRVHIQTQRLLNASSPPAIPEVTAAVSTSSTESLPYWETYIQPERSFSEAVCETDRCGVITKMSTTGTGLLALPSAILVNQTETWKAGSSITVTSEVWRLPTPESESTSAVPVQTTPAVNKSPSSVPVVTLVNSQKTVTLTLGPSAQET
ncbi:unnamed protein product [Diplocarpon coronariae]